MDDTLGKPSPGGNSCNPDGRAFIQSADALPMQHPLTLPVLCGYGNYDGRAYEHCEGKEAVGRLEYKQISLEQGPPFIDVISKGLRYMNHGVIKIGNLPFTVTAQEIIQFVTRFASTPMIKKHHDGYPIHIIMEKPTGKTMDCFIEFSSMQAARHSIKRFEGLDFGKYNKIGLRHVTVDISDQAELMQNVFPRARLVEFDKQNGEPSIRTEGKDSAWSNDFRGFFTLEEVFGAVRFAEHPNRSPFIMKCHQRVYESMISTLYKFPWPATGMYTVAARNTLFEAVYRQLTVLAPKVQMITNPSSGPMRLFQYNKLEFSVRQDLKVDREVGLSQGLFLDLLFTAMNVPAFSLLQKAVLCSIVGPYADGLGLTEFAQHWPFQTLGPARLAPAYMIRFWLELFDMGYERREMTKRPTTFEKYIRFARNSLGFVVAEWTKDGIELPFSVAMGLERSAMMVYLDEGVQHWCYERKIFIVTLDTMTLKEFIAATLPQKKEEKKKPRKPKQLKSRGDIDRSESVKKVVSLTLRSRLNPATTTEFVPGAREFICNFPGVLEIKRTTTTMRASALTPITPTGEDTSANSMPVRPISNSTRQKPEAYESAHRQVTG